MNKIVQRLLDKFVYMEYIMRLTQDRNKDVLIDFSELKAAIRDLAFRGNPTPFMEISKGYTNIWLKRSHLFPEIPCEWVWELKYVKKQDEANEAILQEKRDEARARLAKYRDSHLFAGRNDVRYLSLIFIGKDKYEITENFDNAELRIENY